jgi:hypothetical protein
MRKELSEQASWEWIAAQLCERGLPNRGRLIFKDSDIGRLADDLVKPIDRQCGDLCRALCARLRNIATPADLRSTRSSRKR